MEPPASLVGVTSSSVYASLLILTLLYLLTRPRDPLAWITSAPSLPILGSAPLLPRQGGWLTWASWSRPLTTTSPQAPQGLLRLDLLTQRFILITTPTLARHLLNPSKRRQNLSGRPPIAMIADSQSLHGSGRYFAFFTMNEDYKRHRWAAMQFFNEGRRRGYWGRVERRCRGLLRGLARLDDTVGCGEGDSGDGGGTSNPRQLLELYSSSTITSLVFGDPSPSTATRLLAEAGEFLNVLAPASYIVNLVPQLQWIPRLMNPWKRYEEKRCSKQGIWFSDLWKGFEEDREERQGCFAAVYQSSKSRQDQDEVANPSAPQQQDHDNEEIASSKLNTPLRPGLGLKDDGDATWCLGMSMLPGAYTVSSSLSTILRALVTFPSVQRHLQEELDEYLARDEGRAGKDRMPVERDGLNLPYFQAFLRECQRWRPVIPTGIPHQVMEDTPVWVNEEDGSVAADKPKDSSAGYRQHLLPRDTILFAPEYVYCRDEESYPEAGRFDPARWLASKEGGPPWVLRDAAAAPLVNATAFGWGARRCPGANMAQYQLHIAALGMLWLFDFKLPPEDGETDALLSAGLAEGEQRGGMAWPRESRESGMIPREVDGQCPVERIEVKVRSRERYELMMRSQDQDE